jgi:(p)ppGpp synthase/HD superfamily hydrolase
MQLTERFTVAVDYARRIHSGFRKGTSVPYIAHLLGVASLVLGESGQVPFPVTEDMAIAALLHDAVEDEGGMPRLRDIEMTFGPEVAKVIEACTDSFEEDGSNKRPWEERKSSYIGRLRNESPAALLVSLADKLYNATTILQDYREVGPKVWGRFKRGREQQLWYFNELLRVYDEKCQGWRIVGELRNVVTELTAISKLGTDGTFSDIS